MKFSFLHMADLHLGYYQYNSPERFNDFARAAEWAAQEAIRQAVDFVVVAGDLFHKRSNLQPTTLRQAEHFLGSLRQAAIPCVMIEGNHDRPLYRDTGITWCQYLAQHELVTLLNYGVTEAGDLVAAGRDIPGNFAEIMEQVFVFGVGYKGAGLRETLKDLVAPLHRVGRHGAYVVLALHAGLHGQLPEHVPDTLDLGDLEPFTSVVDYVALGHFHKPFYLNDWIFNPGSLEVTAWDQYHPDRPGGVVLVHVDTHRTPKHQTTHLASPIRPRIQERFDVGQANGPQELGEQFEAHLQSRWDSVHAAAAGGPPPVLRVLLTGQLRFPAFRLDLQDLMERAERVVAPLVCQIRLVERPDFAIGDPEAAAESLKEVEHRVLRAMIAQHPLYGTAPEQWLAVVQNTADLVLAKADPALVYETLNAMDTLRPADRESNADASAGT